MLRQPTTEATSSNVVTGIGCSGRAAGVAEVSVPILTIITWTLMITGATLIMVVLIDRWWVSR